METFPEQFPQDDKDLKDLMEREQSPDFASHNKADHDSQRPTTPPEEPAKNIKGRIAGGKYLQEIKNDEAQSYVEGQDRPLTTVDLDMPLTLTELARHQGNEVIVLEYAPGDRENPFNWTSGYKIFISSLLCLMTLFIGLATVRYTIMHTYIFHQGQ